MGDIGGSSTFDFGNGVTVSGVCSSDDLNIVLVKYDSNYNAQWAKSVTKGDAPSEFRSLAIDTKGNLYAAGYITGSDTFDFGNGVAAKGVNPDYNVVLVKYDSNGNAQWAKSVTKGDAPSEFSSLAIDTKGNLYAAGYITGSDIFDFGSGVTVSGTCTGDNSNVDLVLYDSDGNAQWAKSVTKGDAPSGFNSLAIDTKGNLYTAGYIDGSDTFDFGNRATTQGTDSADNVVLVKYSKPTWWKKNKTYVFIGIGGAVAAGGVATACCAPCVCFSCLAQGGVGTVIHVVVPIVGWLVTPKSNIVESGVTDSLINNS